MDFSTSWLSTTPINLDLGLNLNLDVARPKMNEGEQKKEERRITPEDEAGSRSNSTRGEAASGLMEELNRVNVENKRLTEMLTVVCESYNSLRRRYDSMSSSVALPTNVVGYIDAKKRKAGGGSNGSTTTSNNNADNSSEASSSEENLASPAKKPREETTDVKAKITRVFFRTEPSDTSLIVKDGYQWKKYGQKVTRDNPSPRAYFKCAQAPTCPVKKKVQRSVEDQTVVVAMYEGEHNHQKPHSNHESPNHNGCGRGNASIGSTTAATLDSSAPTITLDLARTKPASAGTMPASSASRRNNAPEFEKFMVDQMASSLTKDPNFTAALVAAISGKFLNQR
ncbi:putative WRKY transcription factor 40 [Drosera capensis]